MKWFRMWGSDILADDKLIDLSDTERWIMVLLMCLASEIDRDGHIPLNTRKIAWRLRKEEPVVTGTLSKLKDLGIIQENGDGFFFANWKKRQFATDHRADYFRKYRKQEVQRCAQQECNMTATAPDSDTDTDTDNTLSSPTETEGEQKDLSLPCVSKKECPHEAIISLYHEILPQLPAVKEWTAERQKQLRARWKEAPKRQDLEWWRRYFEYVRESPFLMGGNGKWISDLEWLTKKKNLVRVIEGSYHHGKRT